MIIRNMELIGQKRLKEGKQGGCKNDQRRSVFVRLKSFTTPRRIHMIWFH